MNKIKKALFIIGYFIIQFIPLAVFCLLSKIQCERYYWIGYTVLVAVLFFSFCVKSYIKKNFGDNVDIARIFFLVVNFTMIGMMIFFFNLVDHF